MTDSPAFTVELIEERDLFVTQAPTNVRLIDPEKSVADMKVYEQWEKNRPFKAKAVYHHPSGADFYMKNESDPFGVLDTDTNQPFIENELSLAPERPGERHKVAADEDIYSIARAHKISPTRLMDHNDITDGRSVKPGMWLYIPKRQTKERREIEYRVLEEPRPMHVVHAGYTTKYMFGAVRKWGDIKADKDQYKDGQNVDIYAVAKVPVEGTVAAYYMDKHDLGNYAQTGRVAFTRGFNWQHLEEGHIEQAPKKTTAEMVAAIAEQFDDRPPEPIEAEVVEVVEPEPVPEEPLVSPIERELDAWKKDFKYFNIEESPEEFKLIQDYTIREFDGAGKDIPKKENDKFLASGWFPYGEKGKETPYYRLATRFWYAIPVHMACRTEDDASNEVIELYNNLSLAHKVASKKTLSPDEERLARIAKVIGKYQKLRTLPAMFRRK